MATREDIQWKLSKLKGAIKRSGSINDEIKALLENATTYIGAEVSKLSVDQVIKLYQSRYYLIESSGKHNEGFANLLSRLKNIDSSIKLVITVLRVEDKPYIVFTDNDYRECFGII